MNEREKFEEAAFAQYFLSTVRRNPNPPKGTGALDFVSIDCKNKDEFLAKHPDGTYKKDTLNSAWWAWNARAKLDK